MFNWLISLNHIVGVCLIFVVLFWISKIIETDFWHTLNPVVYPKTFWNKLGDFGVIVLPVIFFFYLAILAVAFLLN